MAKRCRNVWPVAGVGMPAGGDAMEGGRGRDCIARSWRVTPGLGGDAGLAAGEGTEPHPGWQQQAGRAAGLTRVRGAVPGRPMGPPPSIITGRGNGPKGTSGPLGLSRGPAYRQSTSLPAWLFAPVFDYTRLFRMGGPCSGWRKGTMSPLWVRGPVPSILRTSKTGGSCSIGKKSF